MGAKILLSAWVLDFSLCVWFSYVCMHMGARLPSVYQLVCMGAMILYIVYALMECFSRVCMGVWIIYCVLRCKLQ